MQALLSITRLAVGATMLMLLGCNPNGTTAQEQAGEATVRRPLRVSLYPYIPDPDGAAWAIKRAFEAQPGNEQIELRITFASNYYDDTGAGGIRAQTADVYELDSVFLADFVGTRRIQPLAAENRAANADIPLLGFARSAATFGGVEYGIPHWVCGNFLFYRSDDAPLKAVRTFGDFEREMSTSVQPAAGLLIDLKGKSTLGELYLDGLFDQYKEHARVRERLDRTEIDPATLDAIGRAVRLAPPGMGREQDYHERTGFYARQFARRFGRAYVGYSETMYYALQEVRESCRLDEKNCMDGRSKEFAAQVEVAEWSISDAGSQPIGWVDMLVIDAQASGQTLSDARKFIDFMVRPSTYELLLVPPQNSRTPPRYLLPARRDVFTSAALVSSAPLYPKFLGAIERATTITTPGLNGKLRDLGKAIDGRLPQH